MGWILSGMMLLVLAGIVILNLFRGKKRGVVRTGISVCILIASAFAAIIASRKVSVVIAEAIVTAMRKSDDMQEVLHELPSLAPLITAAIGMLISVTVFFAFYYAIRGILNLIAFLILKATGFQKNHVPSGKDKTFGALMGILLGVMVFCVLSMPLVGYLTLADSACGALIENGGEEVDELAKDDINLCDVQNNVIHPLASSRMVTETGRITNKLLFTPLTTYQVDGRRVELLNETTSLCRVAGGSIAVATILDKSTEITDRQMKILETLADDFGNSATLCEIGSEFLSGASTAWLDGKPFVGIKKPEPDELLAPTMDAVLEVFKSSDSSNIEGDLRTVLHMLASLARSGVLRETEQFENLLNTLGESGVIEEIIRELESNARMAPLVTEISNLGLRALASVLGVPANASEQYDKLMTELADSVNAVMALPEGERVAALSDLATKRLNEYGVEVPQNIADTVAEAMLTDLAGGDITAEGMQEFFRKYAASSSIETYVPEFRSDMP